MKMLSTTRFMHAHLKTRHILLLVELGRRRSIMQAAEAACMNQPAASRLLSDLEYALGLQLFDRNARGIVPNTYGEVMIRRAGAALAEMEAALQEIMELSAGVTGRVVLGSVNTPAASVVPDAVRLLKARFPRLEVAIHVDASQPLLRLLRSGKLDLMIGRVSDNDTLDELAFDPLTHELHCPGMDMYGIVTRRNHQPSPATQATLEALRQVMVR